MSNYWHANYWHANHWHTDYWGEYVIVVSDGDYWGNTYWHTNYWHSGYWALLDENQITIEQPNAAEMTLTPYVVGIDISLELVPPTATMTLAGFTADVANDITVLATAPSMTLTAINTSFDSGETYVGDISYTVYVSSNFDFTDGMNCTTPGLTLTAISPGITVETGDVLVSVTSTPAMTLSALPTSTTNTVRVDANTPTMTLTGYNVVTGFGTVASATAPGLTMSTLQTNVTGTNADLNEFEATKPALTLAAFNPNITTALAGGGMGGGWGQIYDPYLKKHRQRLEEYKETLVAIEAIKDPVDQEIAKRLHEEIETEQRTEEINALGTLIKQTYTPLHSKQAATYNKRVAGAYDKAAKQGNFSSIEAFEREMDRAIEEEEFLFLAMALLS